MRRSRLYRIYLDLLPSIAILAGCMAPSRAVPTPAPTRLGNGSTIQQAGFTGAPPAPSDQPAVALPAPTPLALDTANAPANDGPPFAEGSELSVEALIQQVLARSPSLTQMTAAWKAAKARYPQVTSLDDPFIGTTLAPASFGVNGPGDSSGYRMEIFQRYPFPGKLPLRGKKAQAEADAVGRDVENTRVQLIEAAREAFYDYYLAYRQLEVNQEGLKFLDDLREIAKSRYTKGDGLQQEIYQADVQIGQQRQRLLALERMREVAVGRLNTLMHLPSFSPLPPPPQTLPVPEDLPDPQQMLETALNQRLDLLALKDRIVAAETAVKLAERDYYPDFDVMAAYDHFWTEQQQRPQMAVRINLPVRLKRRAAALEEAKARLAQLHAELAQQSDVIGYEVRQVYEQLRESLSTVRLFEQEVIPAARKNVEAAKTNYATAKLPSFMAIAAQRELVNLRDRYYEAITDLFRRRTVLERALSGSPSATPIPMPPRAPGPGQAGYPSGMGTMAGP